MEGGWEIRQGRIGGEEGSVKRRRRRDGDTEGVIKISIWEGFVGVLNQVLVRDVFLSS